LAGRPRCDRWGDRTLRLTIAESIDSIDELRLRGMLPHDP
jgi:hypothetical protein